MSAPRTARGLNRSRDDVLADCAGAAADAFPLASRPPPDDDRHSRLGMDSTSPWTTQTTSGRPAYPTPTFVREQGLQAPTAARPPPQSETEDAGRWYREWVAGHTSTNSASLATPSLATAPVPDQIAVEDDDDEVIWVPQDEGSDSDVEFLEECPPRPPPPPTPALVSPLPVINPRPKPSLLLLPDAVALPSGPLGTNHFVPYAPPELVGGSASAPPKRGSKLVDLLVLPSDATEGPAFAPPSYYALGRGHKGHEMLRSAFGWDGGALGQSSSTSAAATAPTTPASGDNPEQPPGPAAATTARIAPIATSLLPPQRGLSSALLSQKRVTHSHEQIEASRRRARAELISSVPSAKERARKDREEREYRKGLAAALNAP
jgi:hypothetical protein